MSKIVVALCVIPEFDSSDEVQDFLIYLKVATECTNHHHDFQFRRS